MLLCADNPNHADYKVFDASGKQISRVQTYNTNTKELSMVVVRNPDLFEEIKRHGGNPYIVDGNGIILEAVFVVPGSYAVDKDGKRV